MTIEIKQLVIRAVVQPGPGQARGAQGPASGETLPGPVAVRAAPPPPDAAALDADALVAACTRQVLRELRKRRGR